MRQRLLSLIPLIICLVIVGSVTFYGFYERFLLAPEILSPPCPSTLEEELKEPYQETLTVEEGDSLGSVLSQLGISSPQAQQAIESLSTIFTPHDLKIGQKIYVSYQDQPEGDGYDLLSLSFQPDFDHEIRLTSGKNGFEVSRVTKQLVHDYTVVRGKITVSLYANALRAGASPKMLYEMIKAFSYDIDFQRDIQPGTEFCLFYDSYKDKESGLERSGELLYAELIIDGKPYKIYHFHPKGGVPGYYSPHGEGIRKALLKTPIDGARLTSGFGNRRHPIKGYTKMHKGVDFAAPRGTPIMAAGDGIVERASRYGGYGNYICIRHTGNTKTAYAHLSCYAKGLRAGKKVHQGEIIGYVGSTGHSTGAHLHFELIQNGKHINPQKITQLPTAKLSGKIREDFHAFIEKISRMIKEKENILKSI